MISKKEVKHIAELARLGLKESEASKFQKELSSILNYVEKLKKLDVSSVSPTSHPLAAENVFRQDEVKKEKPSRVGKLLDSAPEKKKGYIKVKSILRK